jgi:hypothetical protein
MGVYNQANAERQRVDREARRLALEAGAKTGEPRISAFDLEVARRAYVSALEMANLVREGRAQPDLSIDQRSARIREIINSSELDRLDYEHKRALFEAQQQSAAEKSNRFLAKANLVVAAVVMLAIVAQVVIAYRH